MTMKTKDEVNIGLCILSFIVPDVGFIHWSCYQDETPKRSKACVVAASLSYGLKIFAAFAIILIALIANISESKEPITDISSSYEDDYISMNDSNEITDSDNATQEYDSNDNVNNNVAYSSNSLENDLTPEEERMRMGGESGPKEHIDLIKDTECQSHLQELGALCELYAADNDSQYPPNLEKLISSDGTRSYIKQLPTCPYTDNVNYFYQVTDNGNNFEIICNGSHKDTAQGYPRFTSSEKLVCNSLTAYIVQTQGEREHAESDLTSCKSNLKTIGTACEMYATDHAGRYPQNLEVLLAPSDAQPYFKRMPTCPTSPDCYYDYDYNTCPDTYTLQCKGNHRDDYIEEGYPKFSATEGLIERPYGEP